MSERETVAERKARLSASRRALLEERLKGNWEAPRSAIARRVGDGPAPLSFAQQRVWFLHRLHPDSWYYNFCDAVRFRGRLDVAALERALGEVVRRHEALRTRFPVVGGQPMQVVSPPEPVRLEVEDLRALPRPARDEEARRRFLEEARRGFDLARDRLVGVRLLRLDDEEHVVVLTMHHIVGDGWSIGVLVRDLAAYYAAAVGGGEPELPPLPIQYADFAAWQREHVESGGVDGELDYWRRQLAGIPPRLELPVDGARGSRQSFDGDRRSLVLPDALVDAVDALARERRATRQMVLLAAFKALLLRYTGQRDMVVGTPIANRDRVELEPLIGFFVNMLVLRTDLSGPLTFRSLLDRVRAVSLDAYAHQALPFDRLVEELQPARSLSHYPLFQVVFAMQNAPIPRELAGITLEPLDHHDGAAKFELLMNVSETPRGHVASLEFNRELFEAGRVERMLGHYRTLLEAALAAPDDPLERLPLMPDGERAQVLARARGERSAGGHARRLEQLFEEGARRTPTREAVVLGDAALSYAELDRRANQLAHELRARGVAREDLVGIATGRSLETAVAVLAVLKAGAAFVPLDPEYPARRLAHMLAEARPRLVIADERASATIGDAAPVLVPEQVRALVARRPQAPPPARGSPDDLAYVVYTSGSTGVPKGIAMAHRPVWSLVDWHVRTSSLPDGARTLQFASLNFDVSFQELFATWAAGGTLVLISEEQRRDPGELLRAIEAEGIARAFLPMVVLQSLAEVAARRGSVPHGLREIFAGGEQLVVTPEIEALLAPSACMLHNHYGPSECHVVTDCTLTGDPARWPRVVPIGRPLPGIDVHVLDGELEPVPPGVPGEVYVGGLPLARGYLRRPALTAERFVADPVGGEPGARLYRTGDLARMRADGVLEFLGRVDHQVKVRGFRVELAEVEAALDQHPGVADSVVVLRERGYGRLIAYVVPACDPPPTSVALRAFVAERLPEYMVPSRFVTLEQLPLDPNGKVDRRALPEPAPERREPAGPGAAPATATEREVARIWSDVLEVERVGAEDNFFELGGTSMLLLRVQDRLGELGRPLPAVELFAHPTVRALAFRLDAGDAAGELAPEPGRAEARLGAASRRDRARERRRAARRSAEP